MTSTTMLVVVRPWELDPARRVWGTGGWTSPEEREGLDWLTLGRLLGWRVRTATEAGGDRPGVCVLACDPGEAAASAGTLRDWAAAGSLVVTPSTTAPPALREGLGTGAGDEGRRLRWRLDAARAWEAGRGIAYEPLRTSPPWETALEIEGDPAVAVRRDGRGRVAVLGFHPSAARDASGAMTEILVRLLTGFAPAPVAWLDLSGTTILRMDDPGGAQNVYSRDWCYPKLGRSEWERVGDALRRHRAGISLAYSAGFVDDGDVSRGRLLVGGDEPARRPGAIHPSPLVEYRDLAGHSPGRTYDYTAEHAGMSALVERGLASVEVHGFTHVHPDHDAWAAAPDRYDGVAWYRELGPAASPALRRRAPEEHPVKRGRAAIREWFGNDPATLVCPGEEWTDEALEAALEAGLSLVGSYYLALRHDDRFCWTTHVCSPYLDEPDAAWFESPLPVVGYMHDRDVAVNGVEWLDRWLGEWERAGAVSFVDYRYLAAVLHAPVSVGESDAGWVVTAGSGVLRPGRAVRVRIRTGDDAPVARLEVAGEEVLMPFGGRG